MVRLHPSLASCFLILFVALLGVEAVEEAAVVVDINNVATGSSNSSMQCSSPSITLKSFYHLVVLVHGYLGSDQEQAYLGDTLMERKQYIMEQNTTTTRKHEFKVFFSKANKGNTTDGVAKGGQRLAVEVREWIREQQQEQQQQQQQQKPVMTLSLIGNSLGGLYARYAVGELKDIFLAKEGTQQLEFPALVPLLFCTTSSPHLGVSQETFVKLPRWAETNIFAKVMQRTGADLFRASDSDSDVVTDLCFSSDTTEESTKDFLLPLGKFQKRIAVANAYNTDFLVSVSSGAFLSADSDSVHYHTSDNDRRMLHESVVLQVTTPSIQASIPPSSSSSTTANSNCVENLDRLAWHKIFMDTRDSLPGWSRLSTPELVPQISYTSRELVQQFARFGTLMPFAHPLNIANAKTELYSELTKIGRPLMDALADMLILDMIELSEIAVGVSDAKEGEGEQQCNNDEETS